MCLLTDGGGQLKITSAPNYKGNLVAGYTVGSVTVPANTGIFVIAFVRLPWSPPGGAGASTFVMGHDASTIGSFQAAGRDHFYMIAGPNNNSGLTSQSASASAGATGRNNSAFAAGLTRPIVGEHRYHLWASGIYYDGAAWKMFDALADSAGYNTAAYRADAPVSDPGYQTNAAIMFDQIFSQAATSHAFVKVEHVALISGNFPLSAGAPDLTYLTDILAGTKDYSSFPSSQILEHWPLLGGDLTSTGLVGNAMVASGTVVDCGVLHKPMAQISVDKWQPGSHINFFGGDGAIMPTITGVAATAANLDYRWIDWATGAAVSGFDWTAVSATIAGGSYSFTVPSMPTYPAEGSWYDIEVRDRASPTVKSRMGCKIVAPCIVAITAGQSQFEKAFDATTPADSGIAADQHVYATWNEAKAGTKNMQCNSGGYVQTSPRVVNICGNGETGYSGLYAFGLEWRARMGNRPIVLVCTARATWGLADKWIPEKTAWEVPSTPTITDQCYLFGQAGRLPLPSGINNAGTISMGAILCKNVADYRLWDWGTADATTANNALADWPTNSGLYKSYSDAQFWTGKAPLDLMFPFGRYDTTGTPAYQLRDAQYAKGVGTSGWDHGGHIEDIMLDAEVSPHQRSGTSSSYAEHAGEAEGNGRRAKHLARGLARQVTKSIQAIGPRMVKFWRDPTDPTIAWIETGWTAGLKTITGPPYTSQWLPDFQFVADGNWASGTIEESYHAQYNASGSFYAQLDAAHPTRIKLTRKTGAANWPASGGAVTRGRSTLMVGSAIVQEDDAALTGGHTINAKDLVALMVHGIQSDADYGRGLPLRSEFNFLAAGGGLVQSAAPTDGKYAAKLTEKREATTHSLTIRVKDSGGNVVASTNVNQVLS
jgi:hypothetical protein